MLRRTFTATAVAASMLFMSGPAIGQAQGGLVNVNISDIEVEIEEVLNDNQTNVQIPVTVQIPVQLAANICGITVAAVLAAAETEDVACTAAANQTSTAEARAVAGLIRRPQK